MSEQSALSRFVALFNPVRAARDFLGVWREENPHRLRFVALSLAVTFAIFMTMFSDERRMEPRPPEITWISTFEPGRSEAEIIASNIANQEAKEAKAAAREADEAEVRARYEYIGKMFGMDVEEARRKGEAERAARKAAEEAARQRALDEMAARQGE